MNIAGLLSVAAQPGAAGQVSLAGGTLEAGTFHVSDGGLIDLAGGVLISMATSRHKWMPWQTPAGSSLTVDGCGDCGL
jgi:hypothetical protein